MSRGLTLERVRWHLENWAEWCEGERVGSGHRTRASGGMGKSHGSDRFDDLVAREDARCARVTDTCIDELPELQHVAVHHVMRASVYRLRFDVSDQFIKAMTSLATALPARGIE